MKASGVEEEIIDRARQLINSDVLDANYWVRRVAIVTAHQVKRVSELSYATRR